MLTKITVEAALNAELDDHLGYVKNEGSGAGNSRNGYSSKTVQTYEGQFELNTPRDRAGSFSPRLIMFFMAESMIVATNNMLILMIEAQPKSPVS